MVGTLVVQTKKTTNKHNSDYAKSDCTTVQRDGFYSALYHNVGYQPANESFECRQLQSIKPAHIWKQKKQEIECYTPNRLEIC